MKALKTIVITGAMIVTLTAGGIMTAGVSATEPETVEPEAVEMIEPETTEEIEPDALEPETAETEEPETTEPTAETVTAKADNTPAGIIESQTGLTVDSVKQFDNYGNWAAYEVFVDGDIYAVTIKAGRVDVVQILN